MIQIQQIPYTINSDVSFLYSYCENINESSSNGKAVSYVHVDSVNQGNIFFSWTGVIVYKSSGDKSDKGRGATKEYRRA